MGPVNTPLGPVGEGVVEGVGEGVGEGVAEGVGEGLAETAGESILAGAGAIAAGALVGLGVLLWPNSTAPAWMDEMNPETGRPYTSEQEYNDVHQHHSADDPLEAAKNEPPTLSDEEEQAIEDKKAGRPTDDAVYQRAMRKLRQREKFEGDRNKQKRKSN